jgi:hypothetical protein
MAWLHLISDITHGYLFLITLLTKIAYRMSGGMRQTAFGNCNRLAKDLPFTAPANNLL